MRAFDVGTYVDVSPETYVAVIVLLPERACYLRNLVGGWEAISGSTLRGEASKWSGAYRRNAGRFLDRLRASGFRVWTEMRGRRRILVIRAAGEE